MPGIQVHCKIWLEKDGEVLFGRGRLELLRGILEYGSLAETARHLGMSYRAAWGRLKSSEKRLGYKLAKKVPAAGRGQKLILTPLAESLVAAFEELEEQIADFVGKRQAKIVRLLQHEPLYAE
ncbi:MAG: LysR family transcriptional regulator [Deltaproteobacteria bacterium]|nr:LysR family transcriptional regulator [Deltaproteobacteria bacterium]